MIPKKVRKIISIIIAVMLVMAVFPAVSFADDGFFGNGDENVASSGDATENEDVAPDEAAPKGAEDVENNEVSQPEEAAQIDDSVTDIEISRNRDNSNGNFDSINIVTDSIDPDHFSIWADTKNRDVMYQVDGVDFPAYYNNDSIPHPIPNAEYNSGDLPDGYTMYVGYSTVRDSSTCTTTPPSTNGKYYIFVGVLDPDGNKVRGYSSTAYYIIDSPTYDIYFLKEKGNNSDKYEQVHLGDTVDTANVESYFHSTDPSGLYANKAVKCWRKKTDDSVVDFSNPLSADLFGGQDYIFVYAVWKDAHDLVHRAEVKPTCHNPGVEEYWECTTCNKKYSDADGMNVITDPGTIPIKAHDFINPTYTWATDYSSAELTMICSGCNDTYKETCNNPSSEIVSLPTCTDEGERKYTASFSNGKYTTEKSVPISAAGHNWGTPTYVWSSDKSTVTATRVCNTNTSHKESEEVNTTMTTDATCSHGGTAIYTATFKNKAFTTQTDSVDIGPLPHDWGEATYTWSDDYTKLTGVRICKNDSSHKTETWTKDISSEVTEPTCTKEGKTVYTAIFTDKDFTDQTIEVPIAATGHDWGDATYKWSDDLSKVTATRKCKKDANHVETETVNSTKVVTKDATETEPGDAIYTAEFTNAAFTKQTMYGEIPAKGKSETSKDDEKDDDAFYINASGAKITWTAGSKDTLNIKFERSEDNASTSKHFLGIEVDGKATSKDLYDTEDGSIIIKLKPALLENLGEGEHTLTALFDDGSASAKFTIIKATKEVKNEKKTTSKNAKTGDASPIKLVIIIMIVSALACAGVLVIKKKRQ